jgi:putative addiction module CopG family antidote
MNVDLNPELQAFVTEKVRSGEYHTAQAVVEDAVRLLFERSRAEQRLEALVRNLKKAGTAADLNEKDWEGISQEAQRRLVSRASV